MTGFIPQEPYLPRGEDNLIRQLTDLWRNLATVVNTVRTPVVYTVASAATVTPDFS